MSVLGRIAALVKMSRADRHVVRDAVWQLLRARLARRSARLVVMTPTAAGHLDGPRAVRIAHLVHRAADHLPFTTSCLDRAIALSAILGARSLASSLRIGVCSREAGLEAHAWVEHGEEPLFAGGEHGYASFEARLGVRG